jgi:hypothetical protein
MTRCRVLRLLWSAFVWTALPVSALAEERGMTPVARPVAVTAAQMQMASVDAALPPEEISALAPGRSLRPVGREGWAVPALRWDRHPRGARWTSAVMAALRGHGAPLLEVVPRDIAAWCPAYPDADRGQRAAFWAGLISTLAWHESTHRPDAVGGGGRWFGLVQIAPGTARWRNCEVGTGQALLNGPANLRCGVRIMAETVPRDGVVAEGMRGVAADWGPFHSRRKREDMRNWVRGQDYCQRRDLAAMRPEMRPRGADAGEVTPVAGDARPGLQRPAMRPEGAAAVP